MQRMLSNCKPDILGLPWVCSSAIAGRDRAWAEWVQPGAAIAGGETAAAAVME